MSDQKDDKTKEFWEGIRPSDEQLEQILDDHKDWLKKAEPWWNRPHGDPPHDLEWIVLEKRTLIEVDLRWANFLGANLFGAILQGAKLQWANLQEAELIMANLQWANLEDAKLQGAELVSANLQGACLRGAILQGADLREANLSEANVTGVKYNQETRFRGIRINNCYGDELFFEFANHRALVEQLKAKHPIAAWLWWLLADYGRSIGRWAAWALAFTLFFGFIFSCIAWSPPPWLSGWWPPSWLPDVNLNDSGLAFKSWFTPYYFSIVTFTTLGFGDVTPQNLAGEIWVTAEVIVGYVMLGGLISILATKLARRS